jgi:hypothetical protein
MQEAASARTPDLPCLGTARACLPRIVGMTMNQKSQQASRWSARKLRSCRRARVHRDGARRGGHAPAAPRVRGAGAGEGLRPADRAGACGGTREGDRAPTRPRMPPPPRVGRATLRKKLRQKHGLTIGPGDEWTPRARSNEPVHPKIARRTPVGWHGTSGSPRCSQREQNPTFLLWVDMDCRPRLKARTKLATRGARRSVSRPRSHTRPRPSGRRGPGASEDAGGELSGRKGKPIPS